MTEANPNQGELELPPPPIPFEETAEWIATHADLLDEMDCRA